MSLTHLLNCSYPLDVIELEKVGRENPTIFLSVTQHDFWWSQLVSTQYNFPSLLASLVKLAVKGFARSSSAKLTREKRAWKFVNQVWSIVHEWMRSRKPAYLWYSYKLQLAYLNHLSGKLCVSVWISRWETLGHCLVNLLCCVESGLLWLHHQIWKCLC